MEEEAINLQETETATMQDQEDQWVKDHKQDWEEAQEFFDGEDFEVIEF